VEQPPSDTPTSRQTDPPVAAALPDTTAPPAERETAAPPGTAALRDSAPRRTYLAAERTYLAWLRTGLGAIGVALAVGRLVPVLIGGSHVVYALLGVGYGVLGIFLIGYALVRARRIQAALAADGPLPLDSWALAVTTGIGLVLAIATIAMVLAET
jgi:putative membrane protein